MNEIQTIGIPRGLMYYRDGALWKKFFENLGYTCIVSPKSSRETLERGMEYAIDESCLPQKMYVGHVLALAGRCDAIFIPRMGGFTAREKMCTRYEALPDLTRNLLRDYGLRILSLSYDWNDKTDEESVWREFGATLGKDRKTVKKAYSEARKYQDRILKERQKRQNEQLKTPGLKVLMAGHPYVLHDAYMGAALEQILNSMGAAVLFTDDMNRADAVKRSYHFSNTMPWAVNREIVGASLLLKDRVDGIVLVSAYPCGPDGLVNDMMVRKIRELPVLQLTLDAQNGTAGLETRIESFIDIIQYQKAGGYGSK